MLNKANRLTRKKDFDRIFKNGRSSYDEIMGVRKLGNELKNSRFGIIVGSKISKKAVERNKIKRRIREIICAEIDSLDKGCDYIIITLPKIKEKSFEDIKGSIQTHFKRLSL